MQKEQAIKLLKDLIVSIQQDIIRPKKVNPYTKNSVKLEWLDLARQIVELLEKK